MMFHYGACLSVCSFAFSCCCCCWTSCRGRTLQAVCPTQPATPSRLVLPYWTCGEWGPVLASIRVLLLVCWITRCGRGCVWSSQRAWPHAYLSFRLLASRQHSLGEQTLPLLPTSRGQPHFNKIPTIFQGAQSNSLGVAWFGFQFCF